MIHVGKYTILIECLGTVHGLGKLEHNSFWLVGNHQKSEL